MRDVVTTRKYWLLALTLGEASLSKTIRFDVVQPRYNLLFRQPEHPNFLNCANFQISA